LAKNVFHAGKVITTVSTAKIPQVPELLGEGVVDQSTFCSIIRYNAIASVRCTRLLTQSSVIDYTKTDPLSAIPLRSVDFLFDTTGQAMQFLPLLVRSTGMVVSISTKPSAATLQASSVMKRPDNPRIPFYGRLFLDLGDSINKLRAYYYGVEYKYWFLAPKAKDLDTLRSYVEEGKLLPVVGARVNLMDIDQVREACQTIYNGKGGLGKTVIEVNKV
jgi:hypothetical protein